MCFLGKGQGCTCGHCNTTDIVDIKVCGCVLGGGAGLDMRALQHYTDIVDIKVCVGVYWGGGGCVCRHCNSTLTL